MLKPKPGHHDYVWTDDMHEESVYSDCPKYSSGSLEVWGAIIFYGKIDLTFIEHPVVQGVKGQSVAFRLKIVDALFLVHLIPTSIYGIPDTIQNL